MSLLGDPEGAEHADGSGHTQQCDRPEGRPPTQQGAEDRAAGNTRDGGRRRSAEQDRQRAPLPIGGHQRAGRAEGHRQESGVGECSDHTGTEENGEVRRQRADDMTEREGDHAGEQNRPGRPPARDGGHDRRADDHPDRKG